MTTPTSKSVDILDDSLGMLSTVALLDSEMSDVNTSAGTSVQERLAGMKITSHHGMNMEGMLLNWEMWIGYFCPLHVQQIALFWSFSLSCINFDLSIFFSKFQSGRSCVFPLTTTPPQTYTNTHTDASYSSHDEDIPRVPYQESSAVVAAGPSPSRKSQTPHILKRDRRRHRKQVNQVYQSYNMYDTCTIAQNLNSFLYKHMERHFTIILWEANVTFGQLIIVCFRISMPRNNTIMYT